MDYTLMSIITAFVLYIAYGFDNIICQIGIAFCVILNVSFLFRHGFEFKIPVILRRPQDVLFMFIYKIQNIRAEYYVAVVILLAENYLITLTPDLPHNVELTHTIALYLFYIHLGVITAYRTVILVAHLLKRKHVKQVLMETVWKGQLKRQPNITAEIFHAYITGVLTHVVLIAPWFMVITFFDFSLVFLLAVCILNLLVFTRALKNFNAWYYRDHWLGHQSELEFLYLHGTHHDAIPSGLIGVSGNGHLEGFLRHTIGGPIQFFNPLVTFFLYTSDIQRDIAFHQYIPGVYPKLSRDFHEIHQHSLHHFGKLKPYGFGINLDQPHVSEKMQKKFKALPDSLKYSAKLDEQLGGGDYEWYNSKHQWFLELYDKYSK